MTLTFIQFVFYGLGAVVAPRVALAILVFDNFEGGWSIGLATWAVISASEKGKKQFIQSARTIASAVHHAFTGKQLIIEREVEKIVEKPVEKIVFKEKRVVQQIRVRDLTLAEAASCLGCNPTDSAEQLKHGYRAMMQKVHPDQGGSTYLAAIVNQAKAKLLK